MCLRYAVCHGRSIAVFDQGAAATIREEAGSHRQQTMAHGYFRTRELYFK